ncbi:MAG: hypothetical protein AAGG50_00830 [Bacteroidota bacterium]
MDATLLPVLIGAAALLLIASGIALWVSRRREAPRSRIAPERRPDDLSTLGIVDIRPLERTAASPAAVEDGAPAVSEAETHTLAAERTDTLPDTETTEAEVPGLEGMGVKNEVLGAGQPVVEDQSLVEEAPLEVDESSVAPPAQTEAPVAGVPEAAAPADESMVLPASFVETDGTLGDEVRSALAEAGEEELTEAIAEVERASERVPRPEDLADEADDFFFDPADLDPDTLEPVPVPDPRDFEEGLDLPIPLPGDDITLVRRPPSRALAHLVESISTSLRAQTVAVLRHDASALAYVVEALKSEHPAVVGLERFASAGSALRSVFGTEPTLLRGANLDALGYYANTDAVGRAYVQPLTQEDTPSLLLVVDLAPDAPGFSAGEKHLLRHFASLFGHLAEQEVPAWFAAPPAAALLDLPAGPPAPAPAEASESAPIVQAADATDADTEEPAVRSAAEDPVADDTALSREGEHLEDARREDEAMSAEQAGHLADASTPAEEDKTPVARRVIVAEEMARARARQHPLALALVHHTEAEHLAELGATAVEDTDAVLREHLEHSLALADGRLEPFGELLYGVFYYGRAADIEAWVELVRTTPARTGETLPLAVGVALYQDRHQTSDQLRADAVQALTDAYDAQVGCVILE